VARNNIFGGSSANLFFVSSDVFKKGGPEKKGSGYTIEGNTFALFPNAGLVVSGANHTLRNNVFELRSSGHVYGGNFTPSGISSTDNLFWAFGDKNRFLACVTDGKFAGFATLEDLQSKTGLETNSVFKDPGFASVPAFVSEIDGKRIAECTTDRLFLSDSGVFQVGDHVEYDFDGVDRVVKETDGDSIVISPPLTEAPVTAVTVMQWGKQPVKKLNLAQSTGKGSNLNVEAFFQGDFNADGQSDVPPWPPGIQNPRQSPAK
jgi:hypothetical protein